MRSFLAGMLTIAWLVAVVALIRGRLGWARIASRKAAAAWTIGLLVAAAVVAPTPDTSSGSGSRRPDSNATPHAAGTGSQGASKGDVEASTGPISDQADPSGSDGSGERAGGAAAAGGQQPTVDAQHAAEGTALAALAGLAIKGRAAKTGYSRDQFGQAWYDLDRNGCDTRNDMLRRDLVNRVIKAGTSGCKVLEGDAKPDKYTGLGIHFVYGGSSEIDIDHVVALGDAWQKGAQQLSSDRRRAFGNDPLNLLAVSASANRQKGDSDAASWLPSSKGYRCAYVARQVAVKVRYRLWVTQAEHDAIARLLSNCPSQRLPTAGNVPLDRTSPTSSGTTSSPATSPKPSPTPAPTTSPAPLAAAKTYPNCDALHVDYPHGVGRPGATDHTSGKPVTTFTVNQAVYDANTARDRDKDGIACEKA